MLTRSAASTLAVLAFTLFALSRVASAAPAATVDLEAMADRILADAAWLADDAREGRGIGTAGLDSAAAYIEQQFAAAGLAPLFDGSYQQEFTMGWGAQALPGSFLTVDSVTVRGEHAILPAGFSASARATAPLVFAGYGITAPEFEYDDYAEIDVEGKIVVVMTGEPRQDDPDARFSGTIDTDHASPRTKAINAKMHGAAGLILLPDPNRDDQLPPLRQDEPYRDAGLPVAWLTRAAVAPLAPRMQLAKLQRSIDVNESPRSMELGAEGTLSSRVQRNSVPVANVGGILDRGSDDVFVIGAHYDHLGYGQAGTRIPGSREIHNGADDNASGVAVMLEIARIQAERPGDNQSYAFVAFTGEEAGLVGSSHFVERPPLPLETVRAMVNLDMVGRMVNQSLTVYGVNSATELRDIIEDAEPRHNLALSLTGGGYGASDQTSFYLHGIPVLHLLTSLHTDYHRPDDDVEHLNPLGMARVAYFTVDLVNLIADYSGPLTYVAASDPGTASSQHSTRRVSMGTIPDFAQPDSLRGFRIQGVVPGKPAERAGLQGGDVLIAIDEIIIDNIYDLTYALGKFQPDEEVEVRALRGGEVFTTRLTFVASEGRRGGGHGGAPPQGHPGGDPSERNAARPVVGHGPDPHRTQPDSTAAEPEHPQSQTEHPAPIHPR